VIRWLSICLALICADVVVADATRPVARGDMSREPTMRPPPRPHERPDLAHGANTRPLYRAEQNLFAFSPTAIASSLRPVRRPASIEQAAQAARVARLRGQICGDPNIQGEAIGRISGRGACGVENAVRIKSVAGVRMSPQPTVDCRTATARNLQLRAKAAASRRCALCHITLAGIAILHRRGGCQNMHLVMRLILQELS